VNTLYALHEALVILQEETIGLSWARHLHFHRALRAGLEAMGLELIVPEDERLPQLNAVRIPDGVDDAVVRAQLLGEYNLEIGAGLGAMAGKVWRVGLMGHACSARNVLFCLGALEDVLTDLKAPIRHGRAHAAARAVLNADPQPVDDEE
jgi:alanine-glyoxylate transaminase/serine-glyoxylate transaminase/serine-pyruvate transaminase